MHIPKIFQKNDHGQIEKLIREYPFATLVTHSDSGVDANHLPVIFTEVSGKKIIQAHIAKVNPLWKEVSDGSEVLLIFNGPNCYVSPNYYPTKKETGKAVPTWNYVVAHVRGVMSYKQDKVWLKQMIDNLTSQHEANQEIPWATSDAPQDYIQRMLSAIVGLEIEITSITSQWKLSQNQPEKNKLGVVNGLSSEKESEYLKIATLVKEQMDKSC